MIGLICVQAVRLLQLRDVARRAPDTPAGQLVPPEWLEIIGKVLRKPRPLNTVRDVPACPRKPRRLPGSQVRRRTGLANNLARPRNSPGRRPRLLRCSLNNVGKDEPGRRDLLENDLHGFFGVCPCCCTACRACVGQVIKQFGSQFCSSATCSPVTRVFSRLEGAQMLEFRELGKRRCWLIPPATVQIEVFQIRQASRTETGPWG